MNISRIIISLIFILVVNYSRAQETVIFRTDRDTYIAGESVWLVANGIKSGTSTPSELSRVMYIEVLNHENVPVTQLKLNLKNGSASTHFELPDSLSTGNYLIRAYTKWMRNYNPNLYFTKNIAVVNPFTKNPFPKTDRIYFSDTVLFYPECGKVIQNHSSKILVQSFDKFGKHKAVAGEIISPSGKTISNLTVENIGYLVFDFIPEESGLHYFTFLSGEQEITIPVARVLEKGISLQLKNENTDKLTFQIIAENSGPKSENGKLDIITSAGIFVKSYAAEFTDKTNVSVDTKTLPSGYLCALLINQDGQVIASRYFLVPKTENEKPFLIETNKNSYSERSPVSIKIENPKNLTNVSVSVVKECLLNYKTQIGKTQRPDNIPFQSFSEMQSDQLSLNDLLISFNPIEEVRTNNQKISFLPEMKGEIISGTIVDINNLESIKNEVFMLSFVGKNPSIDFSETDSNGRFYFEANRFGRQEMVIQPFKRDSAKLNYKVNLDLPFCTQYSETQAQKLFIETENIAKINQAIINMQINVLYKPFNSGFIEELDEPQPDSFYGEPGISIALDEFIEMPSMEEVIKELVPNTHLVKNEGKFQIIISENEFPDSKEVNSFCMVDGVPILNQDNILKIEPQKTEKIDVENLDVFAQQYRIGKIFNLTTNKGDMSAFDFDKRIFRQVYTGYSPSCSFKGPDYSDDSNRNSRIPDFRNVLYWNPELVFDTNGVAEYSFYTSDETSEYTIIVEGLNKEGVLESQKFPFEVKNEL